MKNGDSVETEEPTTAVEAQTCSPEARPQVLRLAGSDPEPEPCGQCGVPYRRLGEHEEQIAYHRGCVCGADIEAVAPPGARACPSCGTPYDLRHMPAPIFLGRDGYYLWVRRCDCERRERRERAYAASAAARQQEIDRLFRGSGIPARYERETLDTFIRRPGAEEALDRCQEFVANFPAWRAQGRGLLLVGVNRSGKTHLATAVVRALILGHTPALYLRTVDYLDALRRSYRAEAAGVDTEEQLEQQAAVADLVALDDLGTERVPRGEAGDWVRERFYKLVDSRYVALRPMLVTTNCSQEEIEERFGLRILRRLQDMLETVELAGDHADWLGTQTRRGARP